MKKTRKKKRKPTKVVSNTSAIDVRRILRYAGVALLIVACLALTHGKSIAPTYHLAHWEDVEFMKYVHTYVHSFPQCFTAPPLYPGIYRPLTTSLYYYLGSKAFGIRVEPLKVFNMFFFVANVFLVFLIAELLFSFRWALLPAIVFASRSAHHDLAIVTVEFQSLLSVFYGLLALYLFIRSRREDRRALEIMSYVFFSLSLFSKESAAAFVAIIFTYGWLFESKRELRPYVVFGIITVVWVALFFLVFRGIRDYQSSEFLYTVSPRLLLRNLIGHTLTFFNFLLPAMNDVSLRFGDTIMKWAQSSPMQIVAALFLAGELLLVVCYRKVERLKALRPLVFSIAVFLIAMAPYIAMKDRVYIRYSYVGHVGIALTICAVGQLIGSGVQRRLRQRA